MIAVIAKLSRNANEWDRDFDNTPKLLQLYRPE